MRNEARTCSSAAVVIRSVPCACDFVVDGSVNSRFG